MSTRTDKATLCEAAVEDDLAIAYLRGDLSDPDRREFEIHILGCNTCSALLEKLELSMQAAHDLRGMRWDRVTIAESVPVVAERANPGDLDGAVEERQRILDALAKMGWSQTRAAQILGVSRRRLVQALDEHHIRPFQHLGPPSDSDKVEEASDKEPKKDNKRG